MKRGDVVQTQYGPMVITRIERGNRDPHVRLEGTPESRLAVFELPKGWIVDGRVVEPTTDSKELSSET